VRLRRLPAGERVRCEKSSSRWGSRSTGRSPGYASPKRISFAEALKAQRLGHQLPGIRGVYAHVTEPMHRPLLETLQERWLGSGDYW
jgi:hypothetical protein